MKVLFASVIYDEVKDYICDFIKSVEGQTYKEFDILIGNDGFSDDKYLKSIKKMRNCIIRDFSNSDLNPSEIRLELIKLARKEKYDLLVFGDSDDTFSKNRIELIVKEYRKDIAFYYNELIIMGKNIDFFNNMMPFMIDKMEFLDDYNFVGMSNSAINLNSLDSTVLNLKNLKDCIAFDWLLYGTIVRYGLKGQKVEGCKTFYRIHDNNIAGLTDNLTEDKLYIGIKVKKFQYNSLIKFDEKFKYRIKSLGELEKKIRNKDFYDKYMNYINKSYSNNVFWWEKIKTL